MWQRSVRIGVDVGAKTLRAVWTTRRFGGKAAWRYAECQRSDEQSPAAAARDLSRLLHPLRRLRATASLTLCAPTSYVRLLTVRIPELTQLPSAVRDHLPSLLPFEVERAQYEFRVRRQHRLDEQWECQLSMAACEAAPLQQDLNALWGIGWTTRAVAPAALALAQTARVLNVLGQDSAVLMEIAERRTTIALVESGEVVYARDVALGIDHLTDALTARVSFGESAVSLARDEAAALIRDTGMPDPAGGSSLGPRRLPVTTYMAMLQPILEQLVSEVRRTMTFGAHAAKAAEPMRVLVSGEGSRLPHIEPWLSQQLSVPVVRLNCEPLLGKEGATAAIACGLALFEQSPKPDLQPPQARQRWLFFQTATRLSRLFAVAAVLIWAGMGAAYPRRLAVARQVETLLVRWREAEPIEALQAQVQSHTQLIHRLVIQEGVPVDWFSRLSRDFPEPVRLVSLTVPAKGDVRMDGEAREREQTPEAYVSELSLWLERARVCRQVQLGSTARTGENDALVKFTLTCQLLR